MEHTPGPWKWIRNSKGNIALVGNEHWGPLAELIMNHSHYTPELQEANARLIAAAPALLKALIALDVEYTRLCVETMNHASNRPAIVQQARDAILAAKGDA